MKTENEKTNLLISHIASLTRLALTVMEPILTIRTLESTACPQPWYPIAGLGKV